MTKTAVATGDHPDDGTWLSTAEAARTLGVTPRTLFNWIDDGTLPAYRFGRVIRVKRSDVEQILRKQDDLDLGDWWPW